MLSSSKPIVNPLQLMLRGLDEQIQRVLNSLVCVLSCFNACAATSTFTSTRITHNIYLIKHLTVTNILQ